MPRLVLLCSDGCGDDGEQRETWQRPIHLCYYLRMLMMILIYSTLHILHTVSAPLIMRCRDYDSREFGPLGVYSISTLLAADTN